MKIELIRPCKIIPANDRVFDSVVGQTSAIKKIKFFLQSHNETTPFPTLIFTGSQGLGKSLTAQKVAEAMDRQLIEINCGGLDTVEDFVEKILIGKVIGNKQTTLFFDEAHKLSSELTTLLLTLLNPNNQNKNEFTYKNANYIFNLNYINVIFATTDSYRIFTPLINRCVEIYFDLYSNNELFRILSNYVNPIKITCSPEDIAYACRGRARDAFIMSQNIKRYCIQHRINCFDTKSWEELKEIFDIFPMGLNGKEIKLMDILAFHSNLSKNSIAAKMGINTDNIESDIEIRPKELGFILSDIRGRSLTDSGKKYIKKYNLIRNRITV